MLEGRKRGTTLTQRMTNTTGSVQKLDMMKAPYEKKEKVIRAKMLPMALFGCETSP